MMGSEKEGMEISKTELMVLLNELYMDNGSINLSYPFYNLHLMRLAPKDVGFVIQRPVDRNSFRKARRRHTPRGDFYDRECPSFNDLREAYVVSGIIPFPNLDRIYRIIYNLRMMEKRSMKSVFFAPDTNVAYLRFFTRNFPIRVDRTMLSLERFRFVISELVQWELDKSIKDKYTGEQIRKMGDSFSRSRLVEGFFNASARRSRRAKDALVELHTLKRRYGAVKAISSEPVKDKEKRDVLIADSFYEFQKRENAFVVMVTADEDMVSHAIERELDHVFIKYPPEYVPNKDPKDPWSVVNLIYTIALRMGAVTIENYGIDIVGEWYGKDTLAYNREMVKVFFNGDRKIKRQFVQSLDISRKTSSLIGDVEAGENYE